MRNEKVNKRIHSSQRSDFNDSGMAEFFLLKLLGGVEYRYKFLLAQKKELEVLLPITGSGKNDKKVAFIVPDFEFPERIRNCLHVDANWIGNFDNTARGKEIVKEYWDSKVVTEKKEEKDVNERKVKKPISHEVILRKGKELFDLTLINITNSAKENEDNAKAIMVNLTKRLMEKCEDESIKLSIEERKKFFFLSNMADNIKSFADDLGSKTLGTRESSLQIGLNIVLASVSRGNCNVNQTAKFLGVDPRAVVKAKEFRKTLDDLENNSLSNTVVDILNEQMVFGENLTSEGDIP
jgi:hypothetical protein